jgi:hypothetical protein
LRPERRGGLGIDFAGRYAEGVRVLGRVMLQARQALVLLLFFTAIGPPHLPVACHVALTHARTHTETHA